MNTGSEKMAEKEQNYWERVLSRARSLAETSANVRSEAEGTYDDLFGPPPKGDPREDVKPTDCFSAQLDVAFDRISANLSDTHEVIGRIRGN